MIKYYKYSIYKKYNDELWGYLINNYNYVKLKHKFLLKLQNYLKKNYFYKKKKWIRYKKFKFIKRIRRFNFAFIFYNKRRLWWIRRKLKGKLNLRKKKRYKIFRFFKFLYYFINKYNNNFNFNNCFNFKIILFNYLFLNNNNNISKININKSKYFLFFSKKIKIFNYVKKLILKRKFYKIKRKLKKTLKADMKFERQFFYSVHIINPRPKIKKKRFEFKIKPIKLLSLYFGFKKTKRFKLLWMKDKMKKFLNFYKLNNFLFILESRLETFVYRINFFHSVYFIKQFIFSKNIYVNNMIIFRPDYCIKIFDVVNINYKFFIWLFKNLKYRLKHKFILLNIPKYIEIDWALLSAQIIKEPKINQMSKPYKFTKFSFI